MRSYYGRVPPPYVNPLRGPSLTEDSAEERNQTSVCDEEIEEQELTLGVA